MNKNIKLKTTRISQIPLQKYDQNFTFFVNGKRYQTNRIVADLLSPNICQSHFIDSTINEFTIETINNGNFNHFLDLVNFSENSIPTGELPFIYEIITILKNDSIEILNQNHSMEITTDNVFDLIQLHELNDALYSTQIHEDIDFISSHFFEFSKKHEEKLKNLQIETLEKIFSNSNLQLKTEDQLLRIINKFYMDDSKYSILYEAVEFSNVTGKAINEFLGVFDINDLTNGMWKSLSTRLGQEIIQPLSCCHRYDGVLIPFKEDHEFNGIINYLQNNSTSNIYDIINITSSSSNGHTTTGPQNVILYNDQSKDFRAINSGDVWICFDFKSHCIIPFNYTIRSYGFAKDFPHPKSWVIEGSNDNEKWKIIDEQKECNFLNGKNLVHTFSIQNLNYDKFQFIRMRQTGLNWEDGRQLSLDSIEFYGKLY